MKAYNQKVILLSLVFTLLLFSISITPVMGCATQEHVMFGALGIGSSSDMMLWNLGLLPGYMFDNEGWVDYNEPETFMDRVHPLEYSLYFVYGEGVLGDTSLNDAYLPPGNDIVAWDLTEMNAWAVLLAKWTDDTDTNTLRVKFEIGDATDGVYGTSWTQAGPDPTPIFMESLILGINLASEDPYPRDWLGQEVPLLPRWDPKYATMPFKGVYNRDVIEGTANLFLAHYPNDDNVEMVFLNLWISDYDLYAGFMWGNPDSPPRIYFRQT